MSKYFFNYLECLKQLFENRLHTIIYCLQFDWIKCQCQKKNCANSTTIGLLCPATAIVRRRDVQSLKRMSHTKSRRIQNWCASRMPCGCSKYSWLGWNVNTFFVVPFNSSRSVCFFALAKTLYISRSLNHGIQSRPTRRGVSYSYILPSLTAWRLSFRQFAHLYKLK